MYVILVENDNVLYGSKKERIMQKEKLFNKLWFLVAPHYNGYDMSQCTVTMRYILPISKEFKTETLELANDRYEEYLKYMLPIDTDLTKEWGDVQLNLTFTLLEVDENNNVVQRVRKTEDYNLTVTQISNWDAIIPDSALSALDQRILKQDAQIKALAKLADSFNENIVDNLVYNESDETLQLTSKGVGVGDKVSVRDMIDDGIPVVDLDNNNESKPDSDGSGSDDKPNCDGNCDCGCNEPSNEENVVEF